MSEKKKSVKKNTKKDAEKKEEKREEVIEEINENIEKSEEKEEKEQPDKKQIRDEKKMFAVFLGILAVIIIVFVVYLIVSSNAKGFTYNGVQYYVVQNGKLTFYAAQVPAVRNGTKAESIYLHTDPRKLQKDVPFNGTMYIRPYLNLNYSNDINCNGDGSISIANFLALYNDLGTKVVRDPNATCDPQLRYVDVNIKMSNETNIQQIAPGCYVINVANCNIIEATERYLTETLTTVEPTLKNMSG